MKKSRRDFIKSSGLLAAGAIAPAALLSACSGKPGQQAEGDSVSADSADDTTLAGSQPSSPANDFGIQLWTVREDGLDKDPKGVLKKLAGYGYKQIESFEGKDGIFWGLGAKGYKEYLDSIGLTPISSHCDINKDFEKKAADAGSIGMKYLVCPFLGAQKSVDDYKKAAAEFNKRGEICRKNGIRFAYHNHDYAFKPISGQLPVDIFMSECDKDLVDFEMDMYWVVTAGADPAAYFSKYKDRFRLVHVKDRAKNASHHDLSVNESCVLGTGSIDYPPLLKAATENGVNYFIVEQERFEEGSPLQCAEKDAAYMKKLSL